MGEDVEFTEEIGIETTHAEGGECRLELELDERHMSMARRTHGGVLFTMLDTGLGRAVISALPEGRGCATLECKINYFRPVVSGRLTAHCRVVTQTRRTAYAEGSITDAEQRIVARASATFFITETRLHAERERV